MKRRQLLLVGEGETNNLFLQILCIQMAACASLGSVHIARAAESPGITVIVVDSNGTPALEVGIEVRDSRNSVILQGVVRRGRFEIPDLPFGRTL